MDFISLFAGIGGFDLGFERAGMRCVAQVEYDDTKRKVLHHHWSNVLQHKDVKECGSRNLPKADVICGGSPCQGFSTNGGNKSELYGTESELIFEFARIADEINPEYIVIENVKQILKWSNVVADIFPKWSLYDKTIKASQCGGYTRRERVFIVGHLRSRGGRNVFAKSAYNESAFETGGRRDTLPMCLPWGGGANLERLGSTIVSTKTHPIRVRKGDGLPRQLDKLRYDWLGNAVSVDVAEYVARSILQDKSAPNKACTRQGQVAPQIGNFE